MITSTNGPDAHSGFEDGPWALPCPNHPLVDEESEAVLQESIKELTLLRSPMMFGDCLAELHAMVSLLAQLRVCIPRSVAGARDQEYTWAEIAAQLEVTPATARRRHRASCKASGGEMIEPVPHLDEQGWTRVTVTTQEPQ
jgi:hypothetical protein